VELLEDTLVVWEGNLGRTNYSQGLLTVPNYGRGPYPRSFTIGWQVVELKPGIGLRRERE